MYDLNAHAVSGCIDRVSRGHDTDHHDRDSLLRCWNESSPRRQRNGCEQLRAKPAPISKVGLQMVLEDDDAKGCFQDPTNSSMSRPDLEHED